LPNTASNPSTATITGRINGAPKSVISSLRPKNRRRARALATGTANTTLKMADKTACNSVNRTVAQSRVNTPAIASAFQITAPSGNRTRAATIAAAAQPKPA